MRFTLRGDAPVRKYGQSNSNANGGDRSTRLTRQRRNANLNLDHNNGSDSRLSTNSANEAAGGLSLTIPQRRTTSTASTTTATSSTNRTPFTIRPFGRGNDRKDDGEDENDSDSSSNVSEGDDDDDGSDLESLIAQPSKRSFGEISKNDTDDENKNRDSDSDSSSDSNSDDDCFVVVDRRKRQRIQIPILPGASLPSINGRDSSPIDLDDDSDSDGSDSKSDSDDDNDDVDNDDDDDDEAISFSFTNRPAERRRSRRLNQQSTAKNDKDNSDDDNADSDMEVVFKIEPRSPQLEFQMPATRHHAHQTRFNVKTRKARPLSPPPASPPPAEPSRSSRSGLSWRPGRGGRGSNVVSSTRGRSTRSRQCSNHPPEPLPTIEPLPTMPRHEMYPGSSVLVFYPTMEEFANFEKFVTTIEPIAAINGICKVVPPAEWRRELEMNVCQNNPPPPKPDSTDINQHSNYFTNEYPSVSIKQEHGSVRIKSEYGPVRVKKEGGKNDTDEESIEILSTTSPHVESALQKSVASASTRSSSSTRSNNGKSSASSTSMEESEAAHLEKMKNCAFLEDSMYQVQQPIVQHFRGKDGILRLLNVDYYKPSLPLSEYFEMCVSIDHAPPSHLFIGERNSHTQHPIRLTGSSTVHQQLLNHIPRDHQYYQSGNNKSGLIVDYSKGIIRPCYPLRRRYEKNSAVKFRPLSSGTQSQQYVARHGGKVEQDYWQNITSESPMYGADISGSLFPPPEQFPVWNLRRLDSILNRVTISMTGINNPYLYIGMYRSTFAWHAEDLDMYSINYLHCGSPKSWFAIPLDQADDFEAFAKDQFPSSHRRCTEFIRHKSFHFSPSAINNSTLSGKDNDGADIKHRTPVQAQRCVQNPGEFMITFPRGYHAGFNQGFNVAEAVNFAMPRWVRIGRRARVCQCSDESVRMEIDQWFPDQQVEDPVSIRVEHRKLVRRIWSIIAPLIEADRD